MRCTVNSFSYVMALDQTALPYISRTLRGLRNSVAHFLTPSRREFSSARRSHSKVGRLTSITVNVLQETLSYPNDRAHTD